MTYRRPDLIGSSDMGVYVHWLGTLHASFEWVCECSAAGVKPTTGRTQRRIVQSERGNLFDFSMIPHAALLVTARRVRHSTSRFCTRHSIWAVSQVLLPLKRCQIAVCNGTRAIHPTFDAEVPRHYGTVAVNGG